MGSFPTESAPNFVLVRHAPVIGSSLFIVISLCGSIVALPVSYMACEKQSLLVPVTLLAKNAPWSISQHLNYFAYKELDTKKNINEALKIIFQYVSGSVVSLLFIIGHPRDHKYTTKTG